MSNNKQQTAVDAYCPECDANICDERVTFEECCDTCGTPIEYHEQTYGNKHIVKANKMMEGGNK
jgi:predicted amidophosphoribosyltransferase